MKILTILFWAISGVVVGMWVHQLTEHLYFIYFLRGALTSLLLITFIFRNQIPFPK